MHSSTTSARSGSEELLGQGAKEQLDKNVLMALPSGISINSISPSGSSAWTSTVRINCELEDGTPKDFFLKAATGSSNQRIMEGSFESEKVLHEAAPENVPEPIAWGQYDSDPSTWFLLADFRDMREDMPEPSVFIPLIAHIHKTTMGKSPGGKYGFHVPTYLANIPNDNAWCDTWEEFFAQLMRAMFAFEEAAHGQDKRLDYLKAAIFEKVIPRLLRPLESEGRSIQPCVVHSNVWPGNMMIEEDTDRVVLFDSCAYWGHNEADLGTWRAPRYRLGRPYIREYQKVVQIDEPREDWGDRNALYALRYDLLVSAMYPGNAGMRFRELALSEMERLVGKYPDGYRDGLQSPRLEELRKVSQDLGVPPSPVPDLGKPMDQLGDSKSEFRT